MVYSSFCIAAALVAVFSLKESKGAELLEDVDEGKPSEDKSASNKLLLNPLPSYDTLKNEAIVEK